MNLPEKTPNPSNLPVANSGELPASTFPAALATCAADALILIDDREMNRFLTTGIKAINARIAHIDLVCTLFDTQPVPVKN